MRRLFVGALIVLLASVGLVALIEADPGYILISYGLTTLESSLWVGMVLLLLINVLCWYLFKFVKSILASGGSIGGWLSSRRLERGRRLTARGALHYFRGEWDLACRTLLQSADVSPQPALNYLLAGLASSKLGDDDMAEQCFLEVESGEHRDSLAIGLTRAEAALSAGQYAMAVSYLEATGEQSSKNRKLLDLLSRAYHGAENWDGLARLLPQLRKNGVVSEEQLVDLESDINLGQLSAQEMAGTELEKTLRKLIRKRWQPRLVSLYGLVESDNIPNQLQHAESWLSAHGDESELLLAVARLSLRNKLWGKARDYLETANRISPSPEVCAELARLLYHLGEKEKSAEVYRQGLLLVETQLPDLPLPRLGSEAVGLRD